MFEFTFGRGHKSSTAKNGNAKRSSWQAHSPRVKNILGYSKTQAKLKIGAPNDRFEQEADRIAHSVVNEQTVDISSPSAAGPSIQRNVCIAPEEDERSEATGGGAAAQSSVSELPEEEFVQMKCDGCEQEEDSLQKQSSKSDSSSDSSHTTT